LCVADLERARFSAAPLDPDLEPIFAGSPIEGEWLTVELSPPTIVNASEWGLELLSTISSEGQDSITTFRELRDLVRRALADAQTEMLRRLALLLRAELSSRVYLCALIGTIAEWASFSHLSTIAVTYRAGLRAMEQARDVLVKILKRPRADYSRYVLNRLDASIDNEEELGRALGSALSVLHTRHPPVGGYVSFVNVVC
jgi:hypothetical protein